MKRFFVFLILFLILTGCQNTQNQDTVSKQLYNQYRQYYQLVTSSHDFQTECEECLIQLVVNKHQMIKFVMMLLLMIHK